MVRSQAGTGGAIGTPYSSSHINTVFSPTSISGDGRYVAFSSLYYEVPGQVALGNAFVQRLR